MNNKGQLLQVGFFIVILFSLALTILVTVYIMNNFFAAVTDSGINTAETDEAISHFNTIPKTLDYSYIFIIVALTAVLIFTSFLIPSHPVFIVVNIIGLFFMVLISMALSNIYGEIISTSELSSTAATFTMMNFAVNYLPYICIAAVVLTSIVMFSKGTSADGGG